MIDDKFKDETLNMILIEKLQKYLYTIRQN